MDKNKDMASYALSCEVILMEIRAAFTLGKSSCHTVRKTHSLCFLFVCAMFVSLTCHHKKHASLQCIFDCLIFRFTRIPTTLAFGATGKDSSVLVVEGKQDFHNFEQGSEYAGRDA